MSVDSPRLPPELIEDIVQQAWVTTDAAGRWPLYQAVSCVCQQWLDIMISASLRYIVLENPFDIEMYRKLVSRYSFARTLTQRAHLRIDLDHRMDLFLHSESRWLSNGALAITQIVPDCKSMHVVLNVPQPLNSRDMAYSPYHMLFTLLANFRSLQNLYLFWPFTYIGRCASPPIAIHTVTYLRIHEYPRCTCSPVHTQQHLLAQQPGALECFHYYLPTLFPNLRHIHFDKPCILKRLTHPRSLELVTLESPPCHFLPERGYFGSLVGWNIVSALLAGFLRREHKGDPQRAIVINTGVDEPDGWQQALLACRESGVLLERRCIYPYPRGKPAVVTRPMTTCL
ncbi:hypothetical protein B0H21DRAFT_525925 [Amylocystis lapponica]|nr:hypothetical protein B0H21DRAFT_525925 [Amylocystis lapponica]